VRRRTDPVVRKGLPPRGSDDEWAEFDRVAFRVVGSTYRSADLAHWLALDVASRALADAGFAHGEGLHRETTGGVLGNTLTGEFSRANILRLRWPYLRRVLDAALADQGWEAAKRLSFLEELEPQYKAPFPPVGEETLAGGLSNTIAGRICNQFDFKGGGYTVEGACASSLLAIANACSALAAGDLDAALAGGVDLSLDPFEIVGFAKTGSPRARVDAHLRHPLRRFLARRRLRLRPPHAPRRRRRERLPRLCHDSRLGHFLGWRKRPWPWRAAPCPRHSTTSN
jgi:acyl transferase domain-containing protein